MKSKFNSMPGIFICINHFKVISRLLVFLPIALLSVGFYIEGRFQTHNRGRLNGWDWVGGGLDGRKGGICFLTEYVCLYMQIILKRVL